MAGRRELVTRVLDGNTLQTATRKNHRLCGRDMPRDSSGFWHAVLLSGLDSSADD